MNQLKSVAHKLFHKHLLITNTLTCGSLLALGDSITQTIEMQDPATGPGRRRNWARTGRMFCMGFVMGPFTHVWYKVLDRYVVGTGGKVALKKILADQLVAGPFFCSGFFMGMSLMEGNSVKEGAEEVKDKFVTVYIVDWCFWPPAQFINFYLLPTHFRVAYVSVLTLFWNTFISWMKHNEGFKFV